MNKQTLYVMVCGAILGIISAHYDIYYSKDFIKAAMLNWPAIIMISVAFLIPRD